MWGANFGGAVTIHAPACGFLVPSSVADFTLSRVLKRVPSLSVTVTSISPSQVSSHHPGTLKYANWFVSGFLPSSGPFGGLTVSLGLDNATFGVVTHSPLPGAGTNSRRSLESRRSRPSSISLAAL